MKRTLEELQEQIKQFCNDRDWDQFHNPKDLAISLVLEASETMEHFQWKNPQEIAEYVKTNRAKIGEEAADVLWFLLLLANKLDVDLADAFEKKLLKNEQKYPIEKSKGMSPSTYNQHSVYSRIGLIC